MTRCIVADWTKFGGLLFGSHRARDLRKPAQGDVLVLDLLFSRSETMRLNMRYVLPVRSTLACENWMVFRHLLELCAFNCIFAPMSSVLP